MKTKQALSNTPSDLKPSVLILQLYQRPFTVVLKCWLFPSYRFVQIFAVYFKDLIDDLPVLSLRELLLKCHFRRLSGRTDWEEVIRIDGMVKLLLELFDVPYIPVA
ncbi:MAG: hypothetical protein AAF587_44835, partial [Bacteroidota bacterium]